MHIFKFKKNKKKEHVGYDPGRIHATIHCDKYNHMKHSAKNGNLVINDPFNTFHTYKLDWNAQRLVFYVDDIEIFVSKFLYYKETSNLYNKNEIKKKSNTKKRKKTTQRHGHLTSPRI